MKILLVILIFPVVLFSQKSSWVFELKGGFPLDVPMPLTIKQDGFDPIELRPAKFSHEPFISPVYWDWRIVKWKGDKAWEFEAVHHKMYLQNGPPEVQRFGISHGYNILLVNRIKYLSEEKNILLKYGIGTVLAHPESTIRGMKWHEEWGIFGWGYYFSGIALNISLDKRFNISKRWYGTVETKFIPSYCDMPVEQGRAYLWNMSFQFSAGLGYYFRYKEGTE